MTLGKTLCLVGSQRSHLQSGGIRELTACPWLPDILIPREVPEETGRVGLDQLWKASHTIRNSRFMLP